MEQTEVNQPVKREGTPASLDLRSKSAADVVCGILSLLATPMLTPVYAIILIFCLTSLQFIPTATKVIYVALTFGINVVVPAVVLMLLHKVGVIADYGVNRRKERLLPYIVSMCCMAVTAAMFIQKGAPSWVMMFYFGAAATILILLIVNLFWKISAHAAGLSGIVALLVMLNRVDFMPYDYIWWIIGAIMVAGLVGTARLWLRRHTLMQVLAGYACGFLCVYLFLVYN